MKSLSLSNNVKTMQVLTLVSLPLGAAYLVQLLGMTGAMPWIAGAAGLAVALYMAYSSSRQISPVTKACKYAESLAEDMANFSANRKKDEGTRIYKALRALADTDISQSSASTDTDMSMLKMQSSMLDALRMNVMIADENDNLVYVNDASYKAFHDLADDIRKVYGGFDPDKALGASIHNFHKDPEIIKKVLRGLKEGQIHKAHIKVGDLTFSLNVSPIFVDGKRMGAFAEWANVTEQLATEEQAAKVQSCIQGLNSNVMMADEEDNLVFANDASQAAFRELAEDIRQVYPGFDPEKVIGASIHNFHKDPDVIRRVIHNLKEGEVHRANIKVGKLTLSLNVGGVFSNGRRMGTFAEWADVTEQRAAEEQAAKVQSCIQGLNSNVMMADENDNLVFANDASQKAFVKLADDIRKVYPGFEPEKVLGASIHNFHKDPDAIRRVLHALEEGDVHRADIKVGNLTLALNVGGVFSNGKRMGTFAEWADVTAQRAADAEKQRVENQVEQSAKAINTATRDIAQGNTNLSERTEAQAASIEETTASMQQITERVNTNAMNSKEALTSANDTRAAADKGGDVVRGAIQAMGEISESSSKINDIIGVIDEIAFQTNLLALNAAVEAARAGEQGRGFAVVASEVRTLAGRSSKAAKEIKSLITESVQKVKVGTEQVNQTGACLNDIIGNVTKVTDMVGDISDASQEQALSIQEINKTIAQMDTFTQQNAALVEEASAASKALEEQAVGLIDLISETDGSEDIQTPNLDDFDTSTENDGVEVREY